jgi:hypothetical protein
MTEENTIVDNTSSEEVKASPEEFQDKEYKDWKRIRSVIEHENSLINYRLTWLIVPQGFLIQFVGNVLSALFNQDPEHPVTKGFLDGPYYFLIAISILLYGFCILIKNSIKAAEDYLMEIDQWWYWRLEATSERKKVEWNKIWEDKDQRGVLIKKNIDKHPPLQGWTNRNYFGLHYPFAPLLFMTFWLSVMTYSFYHLFNYYCIFPFLICIFVAFCEPQKVR